MTVGSRAQVWHGTAKHTSGGLTKAQLMMNKSGRIVSRKKHASAKRDNRLVKAGFKTKKGHFGFVKVGSRKRGRKGMKGGSGMRLLSNQAWESVNGGAGIDGQGITNYGPGSDNVQMAAAMSGGGIYGSDSIGAPYNGKGTGMGNSIDVQLTAGMAGGKRRKMRGGDGVNGLWPGSPTVAALNASSGGRRRRRSKGMYGGTIEQPVNTNPFSAQNMALGAA